MPIIILRFMLLKKKSSYIDAVVSRAEHEYLDSIYMYMLSIKFPAGVSDIMAYHRTLR